MRSIDKPGAMRNKDILFGDKFNIRYRYLPPDLEESLFVQNTEGIRLRQGLEQLQLADSGLECSTCYNLCKYDTDTPKGKSKRKRREKKMEKYYKAHHEQSAIINNFINMKKHRSQHFRDSASQQFGSYSSGHSSGHSSCATMPYFQEPLPEQDKTPCGTETGSQYQLPQTGRGLMRLDKHKKKHHKKPKLKTKTVKDKKQMKKPKYEGSRTGLHENESSYFDSNVCAGDSLGDGCKVDMNEAYDAETSNKGLNLSQGVENLHYSATRVQNENVVQYSGDNYDSNYNDGDKVYSKQNLEKNDDSNCYNSFEDIKFKDKYSKERYDEKQLESNYNEKHEQAYDSNRYGPDTKFDDAVDRELRYDNIDDKTQIDLINQKVWHKTDDLNVPLDFNSTPASDISYSVYYSQNDIHYFSGADHIVAEVPQELYVNKEEDKIIHRRKYALSGVHLKYTQSPEVTESTFLDDKHHRVPDIRTNNSSKMAVPPSTVQIYSVSNNSVSKASNVLYADANLGRSGDLLAVDVPRHRKTYRGDLRSLEYYNTHKISQNQSDTIHSSNSKQNEQKTMQYTGNHEISCEHNNDPVNGFASNEMKANRGCVNGNQNYYSCLGNEAPNNITENNLDASYKANVSGNRQLDNNDIRTSAKDKNNEYHEGHGGKRNKVVRICEKHKQYQYKTNQYIPTESQSMKSSLDIQEGVTGFRVEEHQQKTLKPGKKKKKTKKEKKYIYEYDQNMQACQLSAQYHRYDQNNQQNQSFAQHPECDQNNQQSQPSAQYLRYDQNNQQSQFTSHYPKYDKSRYRNVDNNTAQHNKTSSDRTLNKLPDTRKIPGQHHAKKEHPGNAARGKSKISCEATPVLNSKPDQSTHPNVITHPEGKTSALTLEDRKPDPALHIKLDKKENTSYKECKQYCDISYQDVNGGSNDITDGVTENAPILHQSGKENQESKDDVFKNYQRNVTSSWVSINDLISLADCISDIPDNLVTMVMPKDSEQWYYSECPCFRTPFIEGAGTMKKQKLRVNNKSAKEGDGSVLEFQLDDTNKEIVKIRKKIIKLCRLHKQQQSSKFKQKINSLDEAFVTKWYTNDDEKLELNILSNAESYCLKPGTSHEGFRKEEDNKVCDMLACRNDILTSDQGEQEIKTPSLNLQNYSATSPSQTRVRFEPTTQVLRYWDLDSSQTVSKDDAGSVSMYSKNNSKPSDVKTGCTQQLTHSINYHKPSGNVSSAQSVVTSDSHLFELSKTTQYNEENLEHSKSPQRHAETNSQYKKSSDGNRGYQMSLNDKQVEQPEESNNDNNKLPASDRKDRLPDKSNGNSQLHLNCNQEYYEAECNRQGSKKPDEKHQSYPNTLNNNLAYQKPQNNNQYYQQLQSNNQEYQQLANNNQPYKQPPNNIPDYQQTSNNDQGYQQPPSDNQGCQQYRSNNQGNQQTPNNNQGYQEPPSNNQGYQQLAKINQPYQQPPNNIPGYQQTPGNDQGYQQPPSDNQGYQKLANNDQRYQQPTNNIPGYQKTPNNNQSYRQPPSDDQRYQQYRNKNQGNQQPSSNNQGYQQPPSDNQGYQQPLSNSHSYQQPPKNNHGYQQSFHQNQSYKNPLTIIQKYQQPQIRIQGYQESVNNNKDDQNSLANNQGCQQLAKDKKNYQQPRKDNEDCQKPIKDNEDCLKPIGSNQEDQKPISNEREYPNSVNNSHHQTSAHNGGIPEAVKRSDNINFAKESSPVTTESNIEYPPTLHNNVQPLVSTDMSYGKKGDKDTILEQIENMHQSQSDDFSSPEESGDASPISKEVLMHPVSSKELLSVTCTNDLGLPTAQEQATAPEGFDKSGTPYDQSPHSQAPEAINPAKATLDCFTLGVEVTSKENAQHNESVSDLPKKNNCVNKEKLYNLHSDLPYILKSNPNPPSEDSLPHGDSLRLNGAGAGVNHVSKSVVFSIATKIAGNADSNSNKNMLSKQDTPPQDVKLEITPDAAYTLFKSAHSHSELKEDVSAKTTTNQETSKSTVVDTREDFDYSDPKKDKYVSVFSKCLGYENHNKNQFQSRTGIHQRKVQVPTVGSSSQFPETVKTLDYNQLKNDNSNIQKTDTATPECKSNDFHDDFGSLTPIKVDDQFQCYFSSSGQKRKRRRIPGYELRG